MKIEYKFKRIFYPGDRDFRILQLDTEKQWISGSNGSRWEKVSFDVWNEQFIGWLDIFIGDNVYGSWHFLACDPENPADRVLVYHAPIKCETTDRVSIYESVCEKVRECHKHSLTHKKGRLNWKKPATPIRQRVPENRLHNDPILH